MTNTLPDAARRELDAILRRNPELGVCDGNVTDAQPGTLSSARTRRTSEHDEQVALFQWADMAEAEHPELAQLFAVPNGGKRHPAVAAQLKAEGVRAGVPDVFLPVARGISGGKTHHGLFLELKRADRSNHPTATQWEWIERLRNYGYAVVVVYGAQEAINAIQAYLSQE